MRKFKSHSSICNMYGRDDYECDHCGEYDKIQPCKMDVPIYLPDSQIKRFVKARLDDNSKI